MNMEQTEFPETPSNKIQTLGNHPTQRTQHSEKAMVSNQESIYDYLQ
jgi:hypothetical protein